MRLLRWFAITAALGFACSFISAQFFYQTNFRGLLRRELRVRSPSSLRSGSDSEGACGESEIEQNVTLKGGIHAGYFRKLAQYVAMKLCVELCCEEKGCDVAFMTGRNCYGVQCFSEEQCQSIPAKSLPSEQIFVSHVTFKGEGSHKQNEPKNLKCSATRMKVGVTLRGGLKAGNFTDVGKVDNMVICTKLCCVAEKCDLAMMINQSCFLVSCYTMQLCQVVKAISNKYQPSVAYVMRRTGELQEDTATKLEALHTSDSKLMCKNSQVFYNSTLRGGYKAGNFTDLGKVPNMSACVRLCCGDKNCDAAFMLEKNCYAVACLQEDLCTPVHAKKSGALISLNPRISYITSRTEEVASKKISSPDGTCHSGVISYDVTLRGGMGAGNFTPHGKVGSMEKCIEKCCMQKNCNAAMMLKDACFTVTCHKDELCEKKPIPTSSSYNPKIAFVYRDKKQKKKAPKHTAAITQAQKPTLKHGTMKYRSKPMPSRVPLTMVYSSAKPTKENRVVLIDRLSKVLSQSNNSKGMVRVSLPSRKIMVKTENEAIDSRPTSLDEMVDYITVGTSAQEATQRPQSKPSSDVPADSVADTFVKLTSKVAGKPPFAATATLHTLAQGNSSLEQKSALNIGHKSALNIGQKSAANNGQKLVAKNGNMSPLSPGHKFAIDALRIRQKTAERDGQISLANNGQNSTFTDEITSVISGQQLALINGRNLAVNSTRKLAEEKASNLLREQISTLIPGKRLSTSAGRKLEQKFNALNVKQDETVTQVKSKLPELVKQLETTTSDQSFEESGNGIETEVDENSLKDLSQISENQNTEVFSDDDFQVQRFPGLSLLEEDSGCTNSEIIRNVTLRGGIHSGKFKDRGRMVDFRQCIKICCLSKLCDLAFMLRSNCFTVECKSEELCEAVPVRTAAEKLPPLLAYIYARSSPLAKRSAVSEERH